TAAAAYRTARSRPCAGVDAAPRRDPLRDRRAARQDKLDRRAERRARALKHDAPLPSRGGRLRQTARAERTARTPYPSARRHAIAPQLSRRRSALKDRRPEGRLPLRRAARAQPWRLPAAEGSDGFARYHSEDHTSASASAMISPPRGA